MAEQQKRPTLPVSADQLALAGGGALSGVIINAMAHSNGTVGLLVGGTAAAVSLMFIPKGLRLKTIKQYIPSFYAGDAPAKDVPAKLEQRSTVNTVDAVDAESESIPQWDGDSDEDELVVPTGLFTFSQMLKTFTPSLSKIYIGSLTDGTPVFCRAEDLCHVALGGATGNGKSSIIRMLASQLCAAEANVLLLNPHYTGYDLEAKTPEDWTPFTEYLLEDPMKCRDSKVIAALLQRAATVLLPKRLEKYAHSIPLGKPYYIFVDELPAIVDEVPEVTGYLSKLLRQGRKAHIYLISASQDFLVKTIDPSGKDGGAVRKCYRTAYYTGGDDTTGRQLLGKASKDIPEEQLGKGVVMLRCGEVVKEAQLARVPYVDNQSLYQLLGPSTYVPAVVEADEDDELVLPGGSDRNASFADLMTQYESTVRLPDTEGLAALPPLSSRVPVTPVVPVQPEGTRLADDINMETAIGVWNAMGGMSLSQMVEIFGVKRNQAEKLRKSILKLAAANEVVDE